MADLFTAATGIVLPIEGPYSLQPGDPGGETKWGIARNEHLKDISDAEWAAFTLDDAIAVYRKEYWDANRCGDMPWRWALGVFDGEVNQGSVIRLAQRALGLKADGVVGDVTLDAMKKSNDWQFANFMARRAKAYVALPLFPNDGEGWFTRIAQICYHASQEPK